MFLINLSVNKPAVTFPSAAKHSCMDSRAVAWASPGGEVSLSADTAPHATLAVSTYADRSLREERVALNRAEARVTALARERQQALAEREAALKAQVEESETTLAEAKAVEILECTTLGLRL